MKECTCGFAMGMKGKCECEADALPENTWEEFLSRPMLDTKQEYKKELWDLLLSEPHAYRCGCHPLESDWLNVCIGAVNCGGNNETLAPIKHPNDIYRDPRCGACGTGDLLNATTLLRTALTMLLDSEKADQKFLKLVNDFLTSQGTKEG